MRKKESEKLFNLAYTDAMTGVYNRTAYEERLAKLRKADTRLNGTTVLLAEIDDLENIKSSFGNRSCDDAIKTLASCLINTIGIKADIYRVGNNEFVCIAYKDILPYIAKMNNFLIYANKEKLYKFTVSYGYMSFEQKKHKNIDDLIICCDRKINCFRKKKLDTQR